MPSGQKIITVGPHWNQWMNITRHLSLKKIILSVARKPVYTERLPQARRIVISTIFPFQCGRIILRWRHNGCDGVSNHQPHDCSLNRLFGHRSKKTSKLRLTGLCAGNSPGTGEFPAQMASNVENVSIWWRHHDVKYQHIQVFLQHNSARKGLTPNKALIHVYFLPNV